MHDLPADQGQRAYGYLHGGEGNYLRVPDGIGVHGAAGVFTTLEDLVRWDQNFYHHRVGGAEVIRQMVAPGALDDRQPIHYATGLFVHRYRGLPIVSHAGSFSGIGAQLIRFPEQQLSVICLCNQSGINPSTLALQVAELYLADMMRPEASLGSPLRQPTRSLEVYAGAFRDICAARICQVSVQDDRLAVVLPGFGFLAVSVGDERFQAVETGDPIEIKFDRAGTLLRMHMQIEGEEAATFVAVQLVSPESEQLSDYVGSYFSDELQVVYQFERDAGQLVFATIGAPLEPTIRDGFRAYGMHFEFFRDDRQRVVGYTLYADGASNIRFVRVAEGAA
jgi:hypothetical protein